MTRKTLIFGNGLGMALDPNFFALDRAIGEVWDNDQLIDSQTRNLVLNCLPGTGNDRPHGESDLDTLQLALSACEFLSQIGESRIHWLSTEGKQFPDAVRHFIYHTAIKFHGHEDGLPTDFVSPLAEFVLETRSHVATLNYDNLLYQPFIELEVLKGYDGALVDGFHSSGFSVDHLERKFRRTFGYYMHLHGSPLFVDESGVAYKLPQSLLSTTTGTVSSHIVLTHFKHKPTVIAASEVLSAYWQVLIDALDESDEVILFGCSGEDAHLNTLLRASGNIPIKIVEWSGAGTLEDRTRHWRRIFEENLTLVRLESILDFRDWSGEQKEGIALT